MSARILLLGHDKDYYLANTDHDKIASAARKALEQSAHMSHEEAFMAQLADCATVIPTVQLHHYGATFTRNIAATSGTTVIDRLNQLCDELLVQADLHKADYVLIHSLQFQFGHFGGESLTATAQLLVTKDA